MMQSTNNQSPLVSDDKQPLLHDVESFGTAPPLYPIEESDTELVVGDRRRGFFCKVKAWREGRSLCSARHDPDGKRRKRCKAKARRFFKFLGILFLFFLVIKAYHHYRAIKNIHSLNCTPLDEGHLDKTYVLAVDAPKAHLVFHSSFASPDVRIIRDESLPSGAVHITVKGDVPALPAASLEEDTDKRAMTCLVAHKKFSGAAFVSPVDDTPLPSLTLTTIRIPADMNFPTIKFLGKDTHFTNRKLRRIVNWLRKCHHGESEAAKH